MDIKELKKILQSKFFYEKTENFLDTCDFLGHPPSILGSAEVHYYNENYEPSYMEAVFFDIISDRKWRDKLFVAIEQVLTNLDYRLMNEILDIVIRDKTFLSFHGKKFANHKIVVISEKIYVEMKHPLLQDFSRGSDTKLCIESVKKNDEEMYYKFFSDEKLSIDIEESFCVPEIEAEKIKEWERYTDEALTELGSYNDIYEDMKNELFGLVVDTAIESYLGNS